MKILFVSERFPYPLDSGGNIRTFHILAALAAEHRVTLLATAAPGEVREEHVAVVRKLGVEVRLVPVTPRGMLAEAHALLRTLAGAMPLAMARHLRAAVRRAVRTAMRESRHDAARAFDAVHFSHLDAAIYRRDVPRGVLRVLDEHNVVTHQLRTTLRHETRFWRRLAMQWDAPRLRRFEAATCNAMDATLACSAADASALRSLGARGAVAVVPNGVDLAYFTPRDATTPRSTDVVFVGTLDYDPCERGVHFFCSDVLPLLRRDVPEVRFVVVGRNPSARLRTVAGADSGVILTGRVDDVRPFVQRAGVFVVPLLSGSGTRLKILEAMAMGVPIVTTSIGVEGIDAVPGRHLLVADAPREFADAVRGLLNDPARAAGLAACARALVEREYGWAAIARRLRAAYPAPVSPGTRQAGAIALPA